MIIFRGFSAGAYSIPIRLRPFEADFEFEANLSLGANVNARFSPYRKKAHTYVDVSLGVSITKVNLTEDNSRLGTSGTDPDSNEAFNFEETKTSSPAAVTFSFGGLLVFAENVNIGAYLGYDFISSSDNKAKWIYNGVPWIGVGVNLSFGKADSSSNNTSQK